MKPRNSRSLRRELELITQGHHPREHAQLIESLRPAFAHQIRLIEPANKDKRYTCVMHALDIADPPQVIYDLAKSSDDCYPSPGFLGYMIAERTLDQVDPPAVRTGDLVVYSLRGKIEHVGLVDDDHVLSKWGVGNLWRHPLFEVPARYGSSIRRYRPVTREVVITAFLAFARAKLGDSRVDRSIQRSGFLRATSVGPTD